MSSPEHSPATAVRGGVVKASTLGAPRGDRLVLRGGDQRRRGRAHRHRARGGGVEVVGGPLGAGGDAEAGHRHRAVRLAEEGHPGIGQGGEGERRRRGYRHAVAVGVLGLDGEGARAVAGDHGARRAHEPELRRLGGGDGLGLHRRAQARGAGGHHHVAGGLAPNVQGDARGAGGHRHRGGGHQAVRVGEEAESGRGLGGEGDLGVGDDRRGEAGRVAHLYAHLARAPPRHQGLRRVHEGEGRAPARRRSGPRTPGRRSRTGRCS